MTRQKDISDLFTNSDIVLQKGVWGMVSRSHGTGPGYKANNEARSGITTGSYNTCTEGWGGVITDGNHGGISNASRTGMASPLSARDVLAGKNYVIAGSNCGGTGVISDGNHEGVSNASSSKVGAPLRAQPTYLARSEDTI